MVEFDNSLKKEEPGPEKRESIEGILEKLKKEEIIREQELTPEKKKEKERLKKEIEKISLSEEEKIAAYQEAERIKKEKVKGQLKKLFDLAKTKGLVYAVEVARATDDPLLVDLFHDLLAENERFRRFPFY